MKHRTFLAGIAIALALTSTVFAANDAVGLVNVEYHSVDEILTMYHQLNLDKTVGTSFDVNPDLKNFTTSGVLSAETQQNALDTLNFTRYIAGVSYDITYNEEYARNAQDGALALAALGGGPDHYIDQPSGMSDEMFASASLGTAKSNLSAGISNLATNVIHGWLSDEGSNNFATMGHRRAALSPSLSETGFGLVRPTSSAQYSTYTAMSVQGMDAGGDSKGVLWPAQNMPVEYFKSNYPWTIMVGSPLGNTTIVEITRERDGATWTIEDNFFNGPSGDGDITINNDYYGQPGCIIFKPDNISYKAGDVYHVTVSGAFNASYTVNFFSLSDSYVEQASVVLPDTTVVLGDNVPVVPEEEEAPPVDLSGASSWAQAELQEALDADFPVGVYANKFQQTMTRGEFAHMLGLFCDKKWAMTYDYTTTFTDLGDNAEMNMYIAELKGWGVIDGTSPTTFEPNATITREAIAKLLLGVKNLYLNVTVTQDISGYADASKVSSWALQGVRYMNQLGVLNGTTDNYLQPQGNITVQEAALMCYRFFK